MEFFSQRVPTCPGESRGSKIDRNSVFIAIRRQSGDKWQSKTLLTIFVLRLSIALTFSIAAYPVCTCFWYGSCIAVTVALGIERSQIPNNNLSVYRNISFACARPGWIRKL